MGLPVARSMQAWRVWPCDDDFSVTEYSCNRSGGDLAEFGEVGDQGQLVVEEGRSAVVEERLDDDEAAALTLHLCKSGLWRAATPRDRPRSR